ncbi:MAG: hypothetical protein WCJ03_07210 [Bacteroidales bacterium]
MTPEELEVCNRMRYNQKKYFKTRNALYLNESKKAESELDAILDRHNAQRIGNNNTQKAIDWSR